MDTATLTRPAELILPQQVMSIQLADHTRVECFAVLVEDGARNGARTAATLEKLTGNIEQVYRVLDTGQVERYRRDDYDPDSSLWKDDIYSAVAKDPDSDQWGEFLDTLSAQIRAILSQAGSSAPRRVLVLGDFGLTADESIAWFREGIGLGEIRPNTLVRILDHLRREFSDSQASYFIYTSMEPLGTDRHAMRKRLDDAASTLQATLPPLNWVNSYTLRTGAESRDLERIFFTDRVPL
jgi:hypothetical protein